MDLELMKLYADHIDEYVTQPSLLLMDRLSSHTSKKSRNYIESKKTADGKQKFKTLLFPAKTPFLISPLDNSAFSLFKKKFYQFDRSTLDLKERAAYLAWKEISNDNFSAYFRNCGLVGGTRLPTLARRFQKEVKGDIPPEHKKSWEFYEAWLAGAINVDGVSRPRGSPLEIPEQIPEAELDGEYWVRYQGV
jgi:hypothetical protein